MLGGTANCLLPRPVTLRARGEIVPRGRARSAGCSRAGFGAVNARSPCPTPDASHALHEAGGDGHHSGTCCKLPHRSRRCLRLSKERRPFHPSMAQAHAWACCWALEAGAGCRGRNVAAEQAWCWPGASAAPRQPAERASCACVRQHQQGRHARSRAASAVVLALRVWRPKRRRRLHQASLLRPPPHARPRPCGGVIPAPIESERRCRSAGVRHAQEGGRLARLGRAGWLPALCRAPSVQHGVSCLAPRLKPPPGPAPQCCLCLPSPCRTRQSKKS